MDIVLYSVVVITIQHICNELRDFIGVQYNHVHFNNLIGFVTVHSPFKCCRVYCKANTEDECHIMMFDWIVAIVVIIKGVCKVILSLVKKCKYEYLVAITSH